MECTECLALLIGALFAGGLIVLGAWHMSQRAVAQATASIEKIAQSNTQNQNVIFEGAGTPSIRRPVFDEGPDDRLLVLVDRIAPFTTQAAHPYHEIWPLHQELGALGIAWPGPGSDWTFRPKVSRLLLEACRAGDMELARTAWPRALEEIDRERRPPTRSA